MDLRIKHNVLLAQLVSSAKVVLLRPQTNVGQVFTVTQAPIYRINQALNAHQATSVNKEQSFPLRAQMASTHLEVLLWKATVLLAWLVSIV
jgi:hypothetical protein